MVSAVSDRARLVGTSMRPVEDRRLIAGAGSYLEDLRISGCVDLVLLRSPFAHARIQSIDTSAAEALPGVLAVLTARQLEGVGGVPVGGNLKVPAGPVLADEVVKFVGDPIVAVVAESRAIGQDALDLITVTFEELEAVTEPLQALQDDAPRVHAEFDDNVVMRSLRETDNVDAEFAAAQHRQPVHVGHARVAALPMENRGGIGLYDADDDAYTLYLSTQAAWLERTDLAVALGVPEERIRVITPDVGGAFGAKMTAYREDILLLAAARLVGRPVRWIATRAEDLQSSMHGREAFTDGEVAFDADGRIRALKLRTIANLGSYLMKYSAGPPMRMLLFPTGAYDIREFRSEVIGAFTHTGPVGPYRGAGRPEAAYFIERVVSDVAAFLGMDQAEIRRRNFVSSGQFPYANAAGVIYDSGDYETALDRALANIDYPRLVDELAARRQRGEIVGVGVASCVEVSGGGGEGASLTLRPDGQVVAVTGASPHGQGLETSLIQIISDELAVPPDVVTVTYGDTAVGPRGGGTMGSRSLQLGGSAMLEAVRLLRARLAALAAELLEVAVDDLVFQDGQVAPVGAEQRAVSLAEVVTFALAKESRGEEDARTPAGLHEEVRFQADGESFPFGTTIVVVAIDRETGRPTVERFVSVDDVGHVINPRFVEGQLIGGAVQGLGETLWEVVAYGADGQLLTGSLMDYAAPKAGWLPTFELDRTVTPSPNNPLGVKGVGEAGTVHTPPAVANAVMDALRPFGVEPLDLPLTAQKLWRIIHDGGQGVR